MESAKAYASFVEYLALGRDRSLEKLRQKLGKKTVRHFETWSSANDWVTRAADYDAQMAKETMAAQSEANVTEEIEKFRARARDTMIACYSHGLQLLAVLKPAIANIDPMKLKPSETASLTRTAIAAVEAGINGEAVMIGVDRLLESLNGKDNNAL